LTLFDFVVGVTIRNFEVEPEEKCQTNRMNEPQSSTSKLRTPIGLPL